MKTQKQKCPMCSSYKVTSQKTAAVISILLFGSFITLLLLVVFFPLGMLSAVGMIGMVVAVGFKKINSYSCLNCGFTFEK